MPEILDEFKISIKNKYQVLHDQLENEEKITYIWEKVKDTMNSTCQQVLGPRIHKHKEWISRCSLDKIKERKDKKAILNNSKTRAGKIKAQEKYSTANKAAKKSIREDRRKFIDNLAE